MAMSRGVADACDGEIAGESPAKVSGGGRDLRVKKRSRGEAGSGSDSRRGVEVHLATSPDDSPDGIVWSG